MRLRSADVIGVNSADVAKHIDAALASRHLSRPAPEPKKARMNSVRDLLMQMESSAASTRPCGAGVTAG